MSWLELHKGMRLLTLQRTTPSKPHVALLSKAIPKYEGPKNFPAAPFLVSFLKLAAEKKVPFLVQLENDFRFKLPSFPEQKTEEIFPLPL